MGIQRNRTYRLWRRRGRYPLLGTVAMTMLIMNTLEVAYECSFDYKIDDETTDITVKCKSALPEYEKDEKKQFAASGLILGYFYQLNDLVEEYYEFLEVDTAEE